MYADVFPIGITFRGYWHSKIATLKIWYFSYVMYEKCYSVSFFRMQCTKIDTGYNFSTGYYFSLYRSNTGTVLLRHNQG